MDMKMINYILILCIITYGRPVISNFVIKGPETDNAGANQTCENYGLHLAILETENEMIEAFDFIRGKPNRTVSKFWIGLYWYESIGNLTWGNQMALDYTMQWHNTTGNGKCNKNEDCTKKCFLILNSTTIGIAEDPCTHNHWSLCSNYNATITLSADSVESTSVTVQGSTSFYDTDVLTTATKEEQATSSSSIKQDLSTPNPTESPPGELFVAKCPPNSYTLCDCHVIRNITRNGFDLDVKSQLRVDKKQTNAYIRKLRCAKDDRLSSRVIGCTAVTILVAIFLFIFCLDINTGKPQGRK